MKNTPLSVLLSRFHVFRNVHLSHQQSKAAKQLQKKQQRVTLKCLKTTANTDGLIVSPLMKFFIHFRFIKCQEGVHHNSL